MSREIRRVPADWEHPTQYDGSYQPQRATYYGDVLNKWLENHNLWEAGTHPDLIADPSLKTDYPFYALWNGDAPEIAYYRKHRYSEQELTHIQLYSTTTEGVPISPLFRADEMEQLCEYAAEHCYMFADLRGTKEQWMSLFKDGSVLTKLNPSGTIPG